MKRSLSFILCLAMIASIFVFSVNASNDVAVYAQADKTNYAPGDTAVISVYLDADSLDAVSNNASNTISVAATYFVAPDGWSFAAAPEKIAQGASEISNWYLPGTVITTNKNVLQPDLLQKYNPDGRPMAAILIEQPAALNDEGNYQGFYGSGIMTNLKITIPESAANGNYNLDFYFDWCDNNLLAVNLPSYSFSIAVGEGESTGTTGTTTPPPAPEEMSFSLKELNASYAAGEFVEVALQVDNIGDGFDTSLLEGNISFDNTVFSLIEATPAKSQFALTSNDFASVNLKSDDFSTLGKPVSLTILTDPETADTITDNGTVVTFKFLVLSTAVSGINKINFEAFDENLSFSADVNIEGTHSHSFNESVVPPSCTAFGYTSQKCSCGLEYIADKVQATGHTPSTDPKDKTVYPATCDEKGRIIIVCTVCGQPASVEETDALGHLISEYDVPATCTTDGYHVKECTREGCDYFEKGVNEVKFGHKYEDGTDAWGEPFTSTHPTVSQVGKIGKKCGICGEVMEYEDIPVNPNAYGDANRDGQVNINDCVHILKKQAKWDLKVFAEDNADVNADGRVNIIDATHMLKYFAKWTGVVLGQP